MADVHSPETRSYNMSRIRGKDTKPEELVRKHLFSKGFRYRKNVLLGSLPRQWTPMLLTIQWQAVRRSK